MRTRTLTKTPVEREEVDPDGPYTPDPERYRADDPEFASVEAFVESLVDNDRASYSVEEAQVLGRSLRRTLPGLHKELQGWGLSLEKRAVPEKVRGFTTGSHDRWYGPGASRTAGGSGWEVISGFVGEASSPG